MLEKSMTSVPGVGVGEDAVLAGQHVLDVRGVGDHDRDHVGVARPPRRSRRRRGRRRRPAAWCGRGGGCSRTTSWPAFCRWTAIGLPMMPRPMKAMVVIAFSLQACAGRARQCAGAPFAGQPAQARRGVGGGLVLQADPPGVPAAGELGRGSRSRSSSPGAGLAAAGQSAICTCADRRRRARRSPRRGRRRCWRGGTGRSRKPTFVVPAVAHGPARPRPRRRRVRSG